MNKALVLLLVLLAAGCRPATVYQLTTREPDARWHQGRQLIRREADGVSMVASFDRTWGRYLVFEVVIINHSDSTIMVEPRAFSYSVAAENGAIPDKLARPVAAVDPESELAQLDKWASAQQSSHEMNSMMNALGEVLDVAADIAEAGSRTDEEKSLDAQQDLGRAVERQNERQDHAATMTNLAVLRDYWASRALRRTELEPRQSIGGKIALPTNVLWKLEARHRSERGTGLWRTGPDGFNVLLRLDCPLGAARQVVEFDVRKL